MRAKDGGPAFPHVEYDCDSMGVMAPRWSSEGMSLRDRFAIAVVEGWGEGYHSASHEPDIEESYEERVARFAYALADALMAERDR